MQIILEMRQDGIMQSVNYTLMIMKNLLVVPNVSKPRLIKMDNYYNSKLIIEK